MANMERFLEDYESKESERSEKICIKRKEILRVILELTCTIKSDM